MQQIPKEKRVTPERAMKLLAAKGEMVNREEAEQILDFLYLMASLDFKTYQYENSRSIRQGEHG